MVNYKKRLDRSLLRDEESRRSHEGGWTGALDKLEARMAGGTVP
jgi:hypothetical protein